MELRNFLNCSIIDKTRKELAPDIWNYEENKYILKSNIRNYIIKKITDFLTKYNLKKESITRLLIVGGITSFKYKKNSDCDVNVSVKTTDEKLNILIKNISSINEIPIPDTEHPLNYYFTKPDEKLKTGDFKYDIIKNEWIEYPEKIKEDVDFENVMAIVQSECRAIDHDEDEFKRDIIDYFLLENDIKDISKLEILESDLQKLLHKKKLEIFADLDALKKRYEEIHNYRNKSFEENNEKFLTKINVVPKDKNWSLGNITYKFLDRYGYLERLKLYLHIHELLLNNNQIIDGDIKNEFKKIIKYKDFKEE